MNWDTLSAQCLRGHPATREQALAVLAAPEDEVLDVIAAAFRLRRHFFGRGIRLHVIQNAKSGACSEDCSFCSQSAVAHSRVTQYPLRSVEDIVAGARAACAVKAVRYCIVTSGRSPSTQDLDTLGTAVRQIKAAMPLQICTSLGLLTDAQVQTLKQAGVDRYNHNLETSARFFPTICTAHRYDDRVATAQRVKAAGLQLCSGGLIGMGETAEDRVDLALALRDIGADSIPVNFLHPRPGTPLEGLSPLTPSECLRTLAMFRLVNPDREIRIAGGREACLRHMQPLALYLANSLFTEGYLTTPGQGHAQDCAMIADAGFVVEAIEA